MFRFHRFRAVRRRFSGAILSLLLVAACVPVLIPASAQAQQHQQLPIITGTQQSSMDAPETNHELEEYEHAPIVARIGHAFGISPEKASRWFEDFNSFVLIAAILFVLFRILPAKFRAKRETIARELVEARKATEEAQARLAQIEARLAALGKDVDELRQHAAELAKGDEARIKASMEEERARIVRSAESEIAAAQASAERGLKRFASDLAVERAAARVQLSAEGDQALMDEFLQGLAAEFQRGGGRN
jgi:F-type H+-transporting ATPase subunit b